MPCVRCDGILEHLLEDRCLHLFRRNDDFDLDRLGERAIATERIFLA